MLLLVLAAPFTRATRPEMLMMASAYGLVILLLTQHSGIMEGRYRKPLEPLLIISAYVVMRGKAKATTRLLPELVSLPGFIKEIYLKPLGTLNFWRKNNI